MSVRIWVLLLSGALLILISVTLGSKLSSLGQARTEEAYRKNGPNASASSRAGSSAGTRRNTAATAGPYSNGMPRSNSLSGYTAPRSAAPSYAPPSDSATSYPVPRSSAPSSSAPSSSAGSNRQMP